MANLIIKTHPLRHTTIIKFAMHDCVIVLLINKLNISITNIIFSIISSKKISKYDKLKNIMIDMNKKLEQHTCVPSRCSHFAYLGFPA